MKDLIADVIRVSLHPPHLQTTIKLASVGILLALIIKSKK